MCLQKRVTICQKLQLCLLIDKIYLPVRYYKFILCVCGKSGAFMLYFIYIIFVGEFYVYIYFIILIFVGEGGSKEQEI